VHLCECVPAFAQFKMDSISFNPWIKTFGKSCKKVYYYYFKSLIGTEGL
jgi:hypothetical protein